MKKIYIRKESNKDANSSVTSVRILYRFGRYPRVEPNNPGIPKALASGN